MSPSTVSSEIDKGLRAHRAGRLSEARRCYEAVLRSVPKHSQALNLLGLIAVAEGRTKEGIRLFQASLQAEPKFAATWHNLGNALLALREPEKAEAAFAQSLFLNPNQARVHNDRAIALERLGRLSEALAACEAAIKLEPGYAEAHLNSASILHECRRTNEAIAVCRRGLALRGDLPMAWSNLGNYLIALNKTAEALAAFREARRLEPTSPEFAFNECLVHLLAGNLREAWEDHERRWEVKDRKVQRRPADLGPAWNGRDSLDGRSIVVYPEQGLGDTIQFARYIPLLAKRGAEVHAVIQPSLQSLIGRIEGVQSASSVDSPWPKCDLSCALLSLPRAFATDLSSIPAKVPYLAAAQDRMERATEWLSSAGTRRIGVVWSGNPAHSNDRNRSMPISVLSNALASVAPKWVSLQKKLRPGEAEVLRAARAIDLSDRLTDFEDTAAVLSQLDLVISVDTSVAHLAGAMGIPTWILLPYSPDWRWLLGRDDSPWYPTARLFRQSEPGNWDSVMTRVADELVRFRPAHSQPD
jgi:tetratricopeptide (TPR) repeat protein